MERRQEFSTRQHIDRIEEIIRTIVLRTQIRMAVMEAMWTTDLPLVEMD